MSSTWPRVTLAILVTSMIWAISGCQPQSIQSESVQDQLPVEPPDLSEMGEGVRKQYGQLRGELTGQLDLFSPESQLLSQAWGNLGMWHQTYDYPDTGLYCYQQAERLAPREGRWPYYEAQILHLNGDFEDARSKFRAVLALHPGRTGPKLRLAELELETRNTSRAKELFKEVLVDQPGSAPALFGLGRIAYQEGELEAAAELFKSALDQHPKAARLHYHLAMAFRELGDLDRAEYHLTQVPETNRQQPPLPLGEPWDRDLRLIDRGPGAFRQRAMQARRLNKESLATELFGRALAADPRNSEMKIAYARSLDRIGKSAAAVELLEAALASDPDHPGLQVQLGTMLAKQGEVRKAEEHLRRGIEIDPECLRCHRALAVLLRSEGRDNEAVNHLQFLRDRQVSPDNSFTFAAALISLRRDREALAALEEDRRLLPEEASLRLLAARVMAASSDPETHDPGRAADLVSLGPTTTLMAAETKAMVEAAAGRFDSASDWQLACLGAAKIHSKSVLHRARRRLDQYQKGRRCLVAWERGEHNISSAIIPPTPRSPPEDR